MSRELRSLREELLNGEWEVQRRPTGVLVGQERGGHLNISNSVPLVSSLVLKCQDQQNNLWKAVQTDIREAKSNIATVSSKVQSGNDRLKTVPAGIPSQVCSLRVDLFGRLEHWWGCEGGTASKVQHEDPSLDPQDSCQNWAWWHSSVTPAVGQEWWW